MSFIDWVLTVYAVSIVVGYGVVFATRKKESFVDEVEMNFKKNYWGLK